MALCFCTILEGIDTFITSLTNIFDASACHTQITQLRLFQFDEGVYSYLSDTRKTSGPSDMLPGVMCHAFTLAREICQGLHQTQSVNITTLWGRFFLLQIIFLNT